MLCKPQIVYYAIIFIICISQNSFAFLLDGDNIPELDGRSIQRMDNIPELDGRPVQRINFQPNYETNNYTSTPFNNRIYHAYNPGVVSTTEGYRVELADNNITREQYGANIATDTVEFMRYRGNPHRILPPVLSYSDYFDNNNDITRALTHEDQPLNDNDKEENGRISPTRSDMEKEGIYFGTQIDQRLRKSTSSKSCFVKKVYSKAEKLEKKYEDSVLKYMDRQRELEQYRLCENYIKGKGYINKKEIWKLINKGYTVKNGKVVKYTDYFKTKKVFY